MNQTDRLESLQTLNEVGQILNQEGDFSAALPLVLVQLIERLNLRTGWVFLSTTAQGESRAGEFSLVAHAELPPALGENGRAALCKDSCECQRLFQCGELDQGVNRVTCSRLKYASGDTGGLRVHASIPLLTRATPIGIINLAAQDESPFSEEQIAFLTVVGRYLGTAFERSKLQSSQMREAVHAANLEERERLARDIHDSVTQLLFAADLSLNSLESIPQAGQAQLKIVQRSVRQALEELQAIVELRRPADLSLGLESALTRLVERLPGLNVHLKIAALNLATEIETALYRVAQEAVHNVLRHAAAQNLWLELAHTEHGVLLSVRDDGVGATTSLSGLGLKSMAARVNALGGNFDTQSEASGFSLRAEIPLELTS